jgi:glycosyltransferase involved in cell wall biosynthesis
MTIPAFSQNNQVNQLDANFSTTRLVTKQPNIKEEVGAKFQSILTLPPNPERKGEGGLRTAGYFKQSYERANSINDRLPLVTIVTVVFNGEQHLETTIKNVIAQTYDNVEFIVIDGGSSDRTLEIIRQYEDRIDYWVSESDQGIADAMNKGIRLASGKLIHHLHSGDLFDQENTIAQVVQSYLEHGWRWCYGNQKKINPAGEVVSYLYPAKFSQRILHLGNTIPHSTVFSDISLLKEVGYFDSRFKCAMDYHLWLRYAEVANPWKLELIIARFLDGGVSADMIFALKDEIKVRRDVLNQTPVQKAIDFCVVILRYCKWKLKINTFARKSAKL